MRKGDTSYMSKDEKLDKSRKKKEDLSMDTAGIATKLKKKNKSKLVKVKPMKKV